MTKALKLAILAILIFGSSKAYALTMFNVLGSESKTEFHLLFELSELTGTPLPGRTWSSATTDFQDENSQTEKWLRMMYWNVTFSYDATTSKIRIEAFHKIDPHNSAADVGATFIWDPFRPAATLDVRNAEDAKRGLAYKTDYKDHDDSQGKHSDEYDGSLAYTTNIIGDPAFPHRPKRDVLAIEITGKHRTKPVPDAVDTTSLLLFSLLALIGFIRQRN